MNQKKQTVLEDQDTMTAELIQRIHEANDEVRSIILFGLNELLETGRLDDSIKAAAAYRGISETAFREEMETRMKS